MSWRQFLKPTPEVLRVQRVQSPTDTPLRTLKTLKTPEVENENVDDFLLPKKKTEPQWHEDFCSACGHFNNWRGCCPLSIDECLLSRIIDAEGDPSKLTGMEIGRGITSEQVIDQWISGGDSTHDLFKQPEGFICMAESIAGTTR